jgi:hypothetical protein
MALSSAQTAQLNRITDSARRASLTDAKQEKYTADQLRAKVNILQVASGVVTFSGDNDYTSVEQQTIRDELKEGDKWMLRAPEIVAAGLSIKQRLAALEA